MGVRFLPSLKDTHSGDNVPEFDFSPDAPPLKGRGDQEADQENCGIPLGGLRGERSRDPAAPQIKVDWKVESSPKKWILG